MDFTETACTEASLSVPELGFVKAVKSGISVVPLQYIVYMVTAINLKSCEMLLITEGASGDGTDRRDFKKYLHLSLLNCYKSKT